LIRQEGGRATVTYPLESMSPQGFQQLGAAIAVRVIGPGLQAFGPGPDGGRDFTHHGVIVWSGDTDSAGEAWDGYTVFQAKQRATLTGRGTEDAAWLLRQIKDELDKWADPDGSRPRPPDYLVFVSNVPLTAVQDGGGFDTVTRGIEAHLAGYEGARKGRMARLRGWRLWDRNQISTYLQAYPDVRRSFLGLLTPQDVLGSLAQFTDQLPLDELEPALKTQGRAGLMIDRYVYFEEAGADPTAKTLLADVAIDLPHPGRVSRGEQHLPDDPRATSRVGGGGAFALPQRHGPDRRDSDVGEADRLRDDAAERRRGAVPAAEEAPTRLSDGPLGSPSGRAVEPDHAIVQRLDRAVVVVVPAVVREPGDHEVQALHPPRPRPGRRRPAGTSARPSHSPAWSASRDRCRTTRTPAPRRHGDRHPERARPD
jgi:hypothetical protein